MKKYLHIILAALLLCAALSGCSIETKEPEEEESGYSFYYLDSDEISLTTESYEPEKETTEAMIADFMWNIAQAEAPEGLQALLPEGVSINVYEQQEELLIIDFNSAYKDMSRVREVLTRAGIVKSVLQVPGISAVRFTVEGEALTDSKGKDIGDMDENTFLELSGKDSDSYRYDTFTLYFADESGTKLVKETRSVYYRRTLPKARVVLEQLARGPVEEGHYPSVSAETVALSVTMADRICYVNMNKAFQDSAPEVSEEVALYAVIDSILDSCEADKVQISIEGSMDGNFGSSLPLYNFYEKNEELISGD